MRHWQKLRVFPNIRSASRIVLSVLLSWRLLAQTSSATNLIMPIRALVENPSILTFAERDSKTSISTDITCPSDRSQQRCLIFYSVEFARNHLTDVFFAYITKSSRRIVDHEDPIQCFHCSIRLECINKHIVTPRHFSQNSSGKRAKVEHSLSRSIR